jgi:prophage maintenance system killer protein
MYAAAYLLETFGYELDAEQQELEDLPVSVATGGMETADIALWFESHSLKA